MKTSILLILFLYLSIPMRAQENITIKSKQQFINYLENKLKNGIVNDKTIKEFHEQTWAFWHEHQLDYNQYPQKYDKAITLFYQDKQKFKHTTSRDVHRYESALKEFHCFEKKNTLAKKPVLFIGSSSVANWETSISFPEFSVINRGLGGINLSEIIHYYDDIIKKYSPSILIVYCDIDIESEKLPSEAIDDFKTIVNKVETDFPETQIILMSMKPTLIDDFLGKDVRKNKRITNKQLFEYCKHDTNTHFVDITHPMLNPNGSLRSNIFLPDGMHLNNLGYSLWNPIIRKQITSLCKLKK